MTPVVSWGFPFTLITDGIEEIQVIKIQTTHGFHKQQCNIALFVTTEFIIGIWDIFSFPREVSTLWTDNHQRQHTQSAHEMTWWFQRFSKESRKREETAFLYGKWNGL